ncbi:TetR/AcrR family transcriptional regulator [Rhodococcus pyridinivorans]|uniref:TetR/AcrR family transcriptional regulator n=1 Tax=Rhodococcus pyridinivorans TaxID=103816 RepID=UPI003AAA678B
MPRGEVQRQSILDAFERCLREMPAVDISVKDITEAAGIKRPNFYFYFERRIESTDTAACYRLPGVMRPVHAPLYYREAVRFSATSSPSFRRALRTARLLG